MSEELIINSANRIYYDQNSKDYIDGAPHIKHKCLLRFYGKMLNEAIQTVKSGSKILKVLDLGAGEGAVTIPLLELGHQVTSVDVSKEQLETLRKNCLKVNDNLTTICSDAFKFLENDFNKYDLVVCNSFLHHVPDYLTLIQHCQEKLKPGGVFFSFQDPLRYDTIGRFNHFYTQLTYYFWRIQKGNIINGFKRFLRRKKGIFLEDCLEDNVEYHVVRNGLDQIAIFEQFKEHEFNINIFKYYSNQILLFQKIGQFFGFKNIFSLIALKRT